MSESDSIPPKATPPPAQMPAPNTNIKGWIITAVMLLIILLGTWIWPGPQLDRCVVKTTATPTATTTNVCQPIMASQAVIAELQKQYGEVMEAQKKLLTELSSVKDQLKEAKRTAPTLINSGVDSSTRIIKLTGEPAIIFEKAEAAKMAAKENNATPSANLAVAAITPVKNNSDFIAAIDDKIWRTKKDIATCKRVATESCLNGMEATQRQAQSDREFEERELSRLLAKRAELAR